MKWFLLGVILCVGLAAVAAKWAPAADSASDSEHGRLEDEAAFTPIKEAEMPEGFPGYTPVGEVELKEYPAYRKATAGSGGAAFWTLFFHIKKNDVAMTAPVEMTYAETDAGRTREESMAFLYGNPALGEAGRDGRVEVVDVEPMTVVSTGVRGPRTAKAVSTARQRLDAWLETNRGRYVAEGPMRVMGYNSPFVPREKNFFEVQIPVRPAP
jgi:hypothetical protein